VGVLGRNEKAQSFNQCWRKGLANQPPAFVAPQLRNAIKRTTPTLRREKVLKPILLNGSVLVGANKSVPDLAEGFVSLPYGLDVRWISGGVAVT
jgi:hypothetical protein